MRRKAGELSVCVFSCFLVSSFYYHFSFVRERARPLLPSIPSECNFILYKRNTKMLHNCLLLPSTTGSAENSRSIHTWVVILFYRLNLSSCASFYTYFPNAFSCVASGPLKRAEWFDALTIFLIKILQSVFTDTFY